MAWFLGRFDDLPMTAMYSVSHAYDKTFEFRFSSFDHRLSITIKSKPTD